MEHMVSKEIKRLNHLLGEIDAVYHEMAWKLGVSDSVFNILYSIYNEGDQCMLQDVCRNSGLSKQTINSAVRKLEKEGIVYLEQADPRHKMVCLTEAGKNLAGRTAGWVIRAENEILASWEKEDVEVYLSMIRRYLLAIRDKAKTLPEGRV